MSAGHTPGDPGIPGVPGTQLTRGIPRTEETGGAREDPLAPLWDRARTGIAAVGHGVVFFPLMLAGLGLLLLILALTLSGPGLVAYGFGQHHSGAGTARALAFPALAVSVFLICSLLLVMRRLASLTRRLVGQWCDVPVAEPYLPKPWADGGKAGFAYLGG
jgi:hypothetical protein